MAHKRPHTDINRRVQAMRDHAMTRYVYTARGLPSPLARCDAVGARRIWKA